MTPSEAREQLKKVIEKCETIKSLIKTNVKDESQRITNILALNKVIQDTNEALALSDADLASDLAGIEAEEGFKDGFAQLDLLQKTMEDLK